MNKNLWAVIFVVSVMVLLTQCAGAQTLNPLFDYRYAGEVVRDADGKTQRSDKVIRAFKRMWACPSTGKHSGSCPGWAIDHVIPLAACGKDEVSNMQWLPNEIKSCAGSACKDRWERKVYTCATDDPNESSLPLPPLVSESVPVLSAPVR